MTLAGGLSKLCEAPEGSNRIVSRRQRAPVPLEPTTVSYPLCHNRKTLGRQENHLSNTILPIPCCFSCDGSLTARGPTDPPSLGPRCSSRPPPHSAWQTTGTQVWVPVLVSDSQVVSTWSPLPITVLFTLLTGITPPPTPPGQAHSRRLDSPQPPGETITILIITTAAQDTPALGRQGHVPSTSSSKHSALHSANHSYSSAD